MRTLVAVALVAILVVAGCGSTGNTGNTGTSSSARSPDSTSRLKPSDIKPITAPTKVSWYLLKESRGRRGDPKDDMRWMHLVNRAHPEASKPIPIENYEKVLSNEQMGALVALLAEKGFDRHATAGLAPDRIPSGTANGAITVNQGGQLRTLVFRRTAQGESAAVPGVYIECKKLIFGIFNKADQYQAYTSDDRVLGIERLK